MAGSTEEARQGQDRVCLRAGDVSMEKDALLSLQCHVYISTIEGTRIDRCNKEIWQPANLLRGRRGDSDAYKRGPHRATRRGVCMHEEIGTKVQTIKVRNTQGLE